MVSNPDDTKLPSSLPPKSHSTLPPDPDSTSYTLEKFRLYETRARFYLIGYDRLKRFYHVLKIDRSERCDLSISEDPVVYSQKEVKNLLQRVSEGNRATGGLNAVGKVYGIVGCIKFLESYYLIVVTKRRQIGAICGHPIYNIEESQMITVPHSSVQSDIANSKTELRYKKLLSTVDLTKDFFYSYTYPIMQSLQKNVAEKRNEKDMMSYQNMFVWNAFLTEPIRSRCNNTFWTIVLVHGSFQQSRMAIYGREFIIILISRRSRHFAGTRYLKRGVNDCGWVANDVETEQIVLDEEAGTSRGRMSSVVQMRGSIPLFWSQEASRFSPKPDIILQRYDPTYQATILHFQDLFKRYGNPVIVLTLIKTVEKRPREMMLRREYANAVGYLNHILPEENYIRFIHWDFHKFSKSKTSNVLAVLGVVASEALELTGFYYSGKPALVKKVGSQLSRTSTRDSSLSDHRANSGDLSRVNGSIQTPNSNVPKKKKRDSILNIEADTGSCFQRGVLRTNCIDCLDRTNVAQYAYGLVALGHQLHVMGFTNINKVDPDSSIAALLMDMYANMGDALAHQYGGSAAHNTVFPERQGKWKATTQSREFLKSIKRYYSNTYTDGEKQDAINLFLGYFKPQEGKPALWELDSDYYLHVTGVGVEPDSDLCKSSYDVHMDTVGNNLTRVSACQPDTLPTGEFRNSLAPVPACKQDFTRKKLTSFDKLLDTTGSATKNVRLCIDSDQKTIGGISNAVMAPDAAEIQLKSPNWLFGHRKYEENISRSKTVSSDDTGGHSKADLKEDKIWDSGLLSMVKNEVDIFQRYLKITSLDGDKSWYGGTLIYGQDENSEVYKHYAQLCQGPAIEPFENDPEKERHYREALCMGVDDTSDYLAHEEMKVAMEGYSGIGADLGIGPACKDFAQDPSQLTRWIIGEDKFQGRN